MVMLSKNKMKPVIFLYSNKIDRVKRTSKILFHVLSLKQEIKKKIMKLIVKIL